MSSITTASLEVLSPWRMSVREALFPSTVHPTAGRGLFERFILATLLANMIILALFDITVTYPEANTILTALDAVCTSIYFLESLARGIAFGGPFMLHPLRALDVAVVLLNGVFILMVFASDWRFVSLNALRTVRIARPFFTTLRFPSIRILMTAVLRSVLHLADVVLLYCLFLLWFASAGVNQFAGMMGTRCVHGTFWTMSAEYNGSAYTPSTLHLGMDRFLCGTAIPTGMSLSNNLSVSSSSSSLVATFNGSLAPSRACSLLQTCAESSSWIAGGFSCPFAYNCTQTGHTPYESLVGFENILQAMLTIFTAVTMQLWYEAMFWTGDSTNYLSYPFFLMCVVLGAYLIINLTVVIITVEFEKGKEHERRRVAELQSDMKANARKKQSIGSVVQELIMNQRLARLGAKLIRPDFAPTATTASNKPTTADSAHQQSESRPAGLSTPLLASIDDHLPEDGGVVLTPHRSSGTKDDIDTAAAPYLSQPSGVSCIESIRVFLHDKIVETVPFNYSVVIVIVANLVSLCYVHYGMSAEAAQILDMLNLLFTIFFSVEAVLRFFSLHPKQYIADFHNWVDVIIVGISWVEILAGIELGFVRGLRAVRCLKLLKAYPEMYQWILFVASATKTSPLLLLLLFFMVFVCAIMSMQMFRGQFCGMHEDWDAAAYSSALLLEAAASNITTNNSNTTSNILCPAESVPHANFDTFPRAFLTSFQILTSDDWNFVMYNAMRAGGQAWAIPYVIYFYLGNYVIISLLIAVLLSAHADNDEQRADNNNKESATATTTSTTDSKPSTTTTVDHGSTSSTAVTTTNGNSQEHNSNAQSRSEGARQDGDDDPEVHSDDETEAKEKDDGEFLDFDISDIQNKKKKKKKKTSAGGGAAKKKKPQLDRIDAFAAQYTDRSWVARQWDSGKLAVQRLLERAIVQWTMSCILFIGAAAIALEDPIAAPDTPRVFALFVIDAVVTAMYTGMVLLTIYAYGFIRGGNSFCRRDGWNLLDLALVILSILCVLIAAFAKQTNAVRAFSSLRALRLLRIIRPSQGMKLVLNSLLMSCSQMKYVVLIVVLVLGMWGILGVFLFGGALRLCLLPDLAGGLKIDAAATLRITLSDALEPQWRPDLTLTQCTALGGWFTNNGPNFDNIGAAFISLFQVSTLEGWAEIMYRLMDSDGPERPARRNATPWAAAYVLTIALFGGFFLVNLFISVLIDAYNREKRYASRRKSAKTERESKGWSLTDKRVVRLLPVHHQQRIEHFNVSFAEDPNAPSGEGIQMDLMGLHEGDQEMGGGTASDSLGYARLTPTERNEKTSRSEGGIRTALRRAIRSRTFNFVVFGIVLLNFASMAAVHFPQSETADQLQFYVELVFMSIFVVEAAAKIFAESPRMYFSSMWHRFDFAVTVGVVLGVIIQSRALALLRAVRVVRLARFARGKLQLDSLITQFASAFVSLAHVGTVCALIFFIFAVIGMKLFGRVYVAPYGTTSGLDTHSNFQNAGTAMTLLMRVMTGGNWADIMWSVSQEPPLCDPQLGNCGLPTPIPQLYFGIFVTISMFVLRNLLTAVLLDSFGSSGQNRAITKDHATRLYHSWIRYDPYETMYISPFKVLFFVRSLPHNCALGFQGQQGSRRIASELSFMTSLKLKSVFTPVSFDTVMEALCATAYACPPPEDRSFMHRSQALSARDDEVMSVFEPSNGATPPTEDVAATVANGPSFDEEKGKKSHLPATCAALIMINAVISRKRAQIRRRKRAAERKAREDAAIGSPAPDEALLGTAAATTGASTDPVTTTSAVVATSSSAAKVASPASHRVAFSAISDDEGSNSDLDLPPPTGPRSSGGMKFSSSSSSPSPAGPRRGGRTPPQRRLRSVDSFSSSSSDDEIDRLKRHIEDLEI